MCHQTNYPTSSNYFGHLSLHSIIIDHFYYNYLPNRSIGFLATKKLVEFFISRINSEVVGLLYASRASLMSGIKLED